MSVFQMVAYLVATWAEWSVFGMVAMKAVLMAASMGASLVAEKVDH